jgi:arylformamidase
MKMENSKVSKWIDVSQPIGDGMICWPGRRPPDHNWEKQIVDGDHCNTSIWTLSAHTGTHIDAPLHFVNGGKSIDLISPDLLIGKCRVVDLEGAGNLGNSKPSGLELAQGKSYCGESRLLIRTRPSMVDDKYAHHGALLSLETARMLIDSGLVLIGTDRLSVDDTQSDDYAVHHFLLQAGCIIIEGLSLEGLDSGWYQMIALPLRLEGAEASPARVFLSTSIENSGK